MSVAERDRYTGHMTTGHDWNGIKELNTPVPRILFAFLGSAFLFALGYWYFMPAWPTGNDYTRGKLGIDQQNQVREQLAEAAERRSSWVTAMENSDFSEIRSNPELMKVVATSGAALYRDNCSMCHGSEGDGGRYFPRLSDEVWLWGNDPSSILKTLQVGINSHHPESRVAQMPAFGSNGALDGTAIDNVVLYLRSRSDSSIGSGSRADELLAVNAGEKTYTTVCAACHGVDMKGNTALGAPNLADDFWIYGSDQASLHTTIWDGRAGHMPAWESRLSLAERKILTLHVLSFSANAKGGDDNNAADERR